MSDTAEHITHVEPAPRPDSATEMGEADVRMSVTPIDNASTGSGCDGSAPRRITRGKLFIGGLSWDTTEETMTAYFGAYGEMTDVVIMRNRSNGQPRGFGFVTYKQPEVAEVVLAKQPHTLDGRTVEVKAAVPKEDVQTNRSPGLEGQMARRGSSGSISEFVLPYGPSPHCESVGSDYGGDHGSHHAPDPRKVFVGGLAPTVSDASLRHYFEQLDLCDIADAIVMVDKETQRSRGFGFVTFVDEGAVDKVLSQTHTIEGRTVEVKRAKPKPDPSGDKHMRAEPTGQFGVYSDARGGAQGYIQESGRARSGSHGSMHFEQPPPQMTASYYPSPYTASSVPVAYVYAPPTYTTDPRAAYNGAAYGQMSPPMEYSMGYTVQPGYGSPDTSMHQKQMYVVPTMRPAVDMYGRPLPQSGQGMPGAPRRAPQYAPAPGYVYSTAATPYPTTAPQVVYYAPMMPYSYSMPPPTVPQPQMPRPTIVAPAPAYSGTPPTRSTPASSGGRSVDSGIVEPSAVPAIAE